MDDAIFFAFFLMDLIDFLIFFMRFTRLLHFFTKSMLSPLSNNFKLKNNIFLNDTAYIKYNLSKKHWQSLNSYKTILQTTPAPVGL